MRHCPTCDSAEVVSLGVAGEGWAFACEDCGRMWTEDDRWIEEGGSL